MYIVVNFNFIFKFLNLKIILQNDHNPDVTSKSGFTPLHIAAHYGNDKVASLLYEKGANVNYAAKHNITPLHVASKWGKMNMVTLLISKGAEIQAKTRDGLTPLHCAARSGHDQVVDVLLENGAPMHSKTKVRIVKKETINIFILWSFILNEVKEQNQFHKHHLYFILGLIYLFNCVSTALSS